MNIKNIAYSVLFLTCLFTLQGCKDQWDDHNGLTNEANKLTLTEQIATDPTLSKFYEYLVSTGYDKVLESSQTFTVWAPSNTALEALNTAEPGYLTNAINLKSFIGNHIVKMMYPISKAGDTLRVQTLNGKYINMINDKFENILITKADQYTKNGVLHVVGQAVPVKVRIWTILNALTGYSQIAAMKSLDTVVLGAAGDTIANKMSPTWLLYSAALNTENRQYTYFVLNNSAFATEISKIMPYYQSTSISPDSTTEYLTKLSMLKDVMVSGIYTVENLVDTPLIAVSGVRIPIKKANIIASIPASNGIVHIVNALPYPLNYKIKDIVIQGELPSSFRNTEKRSVTYYRTKADTLGKKYQDIEIYAHVTSEYYIDYKGRGLNSVTYKVFGRAVFGLPGDSQITGFTQRVAFADVATGLYSLNYTGALPFVVGHRTGKTRFDEYELGTYTKTKFGTINFRLISAAVTTTGINTLMLDYIRLEPVLPQ
ncbi:fasciclin domain-containing protein [Arcticibacter eurypsychrophilus]|uniref:fasciclin domain-containing protein n=1 Tax=Arcticibacter eurypsychrophilus TaxID=1434752 RepID=UPI00084D463B|nr:fasciclin domain-containing protein [Arcticibacter eurypsychrophilus]